MNWYVLFIRTGCERKAEKYLNKRLDNNIFSPFILMEQMLFKTSGQIKKELKPIFPGYVFIETEATRQEIIKEMQDIFHTSHDIFRFVKYGDTGDIAMKEDERNTLQKLCNDDHCIEASSGIIAGNRVYVKEGPLKGFESIIRKIDRHKRRAFIELDFMGDVRKVAVALEIVEKI